MRKTYRSSFVLVEIMVVIAIISLVAAIAIPNLLRVRMNTNEISAITALRNMYSSLIMYYSSNGNSYPEQLANLTGYLNQALVDGEKTGYAFNYIRDSANKFHVNANPLIPGNTGGRYFYLDERSVVRFNESGEAGADDPSTK